MKWGVNCKVFNDLGKWELTVKFSMTQGNGELAVKCSMSQGNGESTCKVQVVSLFKDEEVYTCHTTTEAMS